MEIKPYTILDEVFELETKRNKLADRLKDKFHTVLKPFFNKSENITSIGWTQSSPYNDIDYSFQVGEIIINGVSPYDDEENNLLIYETEAELITEIQKTISSIPEDMMESMFGKGIKITFHKDGRIEEDEYEDY